MFFFFLANRKILFPNYSLGSFFLARLRKVGNVETENHKVRFRFTVFIFVTIQCLIKSLSTIYICFNNLNSQRKVFKFELRKESIQIVLTN